MMFILSVGRDPDALNKRSAFLAAAGYAIVSVTEMPKAAEKIANEEFDLVILCNSLVEEDRRQLVNMILRHRPFMPLILIPEGSTDEETGRRVAETLGEPVSGRASSQAV